MNSISTLPPAASPAAIDAMMQLVAVLADPQAVQKVLADIKAARDEAEAAAAKLGDLDAKAAALAKQRTAFEGWCTAEREKIERARLDLATAQQRLQREKDDHVAAVA